MAGKTSTFINNSPPSADATWLNLNQQEQNNLITGTGQSLSDAINNQQAISASRFAANNFYTDSGSADNYILTLTASFTNPVSSSIGYFEGMTIRFRPGNANTGGAAQVNVNGAGNKSLKEADGTINPPAGVMTTFQDVEFRYDGSVFRRVTSGSAATTSSLGTVYINQPITISNNVSDPNNDINFSAGNYSFDDDSGQASYIGGTGQLDVVFGTGNGMLDTGSKQANSIYYLFLVTELTSQITKPLASLSKTNPSIGSGYKKNLCGYITTDSSSNINSITTISQNNSIIQTRNFQTGAVATGTTAIPTDDTPPQQSTEGTQVMSLEITPQNANNVLQIDVVVNMSAAVGCYGCIALFQDSIANAIATSEVDLQANYTSQGVLKYRMKAGTTSKTTFKVKIGGNNTTTYTFNGMAGSRLFGGTLASSITITEMKI